MVHIFEKTNLVEHDIVFKACKEHIPDPVFDLAEDASKIGDREKEVIRQRSSRQTPRRT